MLSQLQSPWPGGDSPVPSAMKEILAVDEMLMTRPGSVAVASFSRRGVRLRDMSMGTGGDTADTSILGCHW